MYPKKPTSHKSPATDSRSAPSTPKTSGGRRIQVRQSGIHGKGVFALVPIAAGERIMEYTGNVITWKEAQRRHPHDPDDPNHTFYFHIDDKHVIDGADGGNSAKWINHACGPNCEADEIDGRVFVNALRDIAPGEELNYDYGLILEGRHTAKVKKQFECRCGTQECRGTMLAPKKR
jgi:SET domain-containing protein